jgi:hypothetical protein
MRARVARWSREAPRQALYSLVLCALVLLSVPSLTSAAWQCEGRVCGTTPWACCCASPKDTYDPTCGPRADDLQKHRGEQSHQDEVSACAVACHCVMVVQSDSPVILSAIAPLPSPLEVVAVLPIVATIQAPIADSVRLSAPPRGPPHTSPTHPVASGRAPPVL